jgi:hypothetical protein
MNESTIKGTIIKFKDTVTGTGQRGDWKKREIHVESNSQYPKLVILTAWGDKVDSISANYKVGDTIHVLCHVESREFNDKGYTEIKPFKIIED